MKNIWRTIFFADRPAAGAWFGLSLLITGTYLTYVALLVAWGYSWIDINFGMPICWGGTSWPAVYCALGIVLGLWLLYTFFTLRFYFGLLAQSRPDSIRVYRWDAVGILLLIGMAGICIPARGWIFSLGLLGFGWYWLLFTGARIRWRNVPPAAASVLLEGAGIFGGFVLFQHLLATFTNWPDLVNGKTKMLPPVMFTAIGKIPGMIPVGWSVFAILAVAALAAAWWLRLRIWAQWSGQPVRTLWSRRAATLWLIALAVYTAGLLLAWRADGAVRLLRERLDMRFGHPLRAETLAELYHPDAPPDPEYWQRLKALLTQLEPQFRQAIGTDDFTVPKRDWSPERRAEIQKQLGNFERDWNEVESMLDGPISRYPLEFVPERLLYLPIPHLYYLRTAARIERMRLDLALGSGDRQGALAIYRRLENIGRHLSREVGAIGQYVFLAVENMRLDALELLVASGLYTDVELAQWADELKDLEPLIETGARLLLDSEAIFAIDTVDGIRSGRLLESAPASAYTPLPPARLRYAMPYMWWLLGRDEVRVLRAFDREIFAPPDSDGTCPCCSPLNTFRGILDEIAFKQEQRFSETIDRSRAERLLIDQELYRRKYGEYPAESDFTLKPRNPECRFIREFGPVQPRYYEVPMEPVFDGNTPYEKIPIPETRPFWILRIQSEGDHRSQVRARLWVEPGKGPITMTLHCLLDIIAPGRTEIPGVPRFPCLGSMMPDDLGPGYGTQPKWLFPPPAAVSP